MFFPLGQLKLKELGIDLNINGVIHVGAHKGQEVRHYVDRGIKNIILFEPHPGSFSALSGRMKNLDEDIILVNKAAGNINGQRKLFKSSNSGMSSSLLKPRRHLEKYPSIKFDGGTLVDVVRLDDYIVNPEEYNYMSIDVQGYELEVLKGSVNLLEHIDYIMTEVNSIYLYAGGVLIDELDEFLAEHNFKRIYCTKDVEHMKRIEKWADAFYVKTK